MVFGLAVVSAAAVDEDGRSASPHPTSRSGNLYAETEASGPPQAGTPGRNGLGQIKQGYVEESNVDVVGELVDLIGAQRTYELNSKVVKAGDRIMQATNQLVR